MKHTRIKALAAAMLLLTTMTGCGAGSGISLGHSAKAVELTAGMRSTGSESTKPDEAFLQGQTAFALSLMQEAAKTREGRNVLLSPYSLMQALAMTANGAAGDTRAEMEQVLGGLPLDTLNSGLNYERQNARKTVMNLVFYTFVGLTLICTSRSCCSVTSVGAPRRRSCALELSGNAITSRMLSSSRSSIIMRSIPNAIPA